MGETKYTVTATSLYAAMIAFGNLSDTEIAGLLGLEEEDVQNIKDEEGHLLVGAMMKKYFSDVAH